MIRRIVLAAALVLAAGGAIAWFGARWYAGPLVSVAEVRRGPAVEAVYATANVEPVSWARIGPLETGRLVGLDAHEGDRVAAGDVLGRQDDREERARLEELRARERWLRAELERASALARRGVLSDQAEQRARSELDQVLAGIVAAQQRIERLTLRSPIEGVVMRRDRELGEVVRPGDTVFTVGQISPLWAVADVDEQDIPLIRVGQTALIRADAFPGRVLEGRVAEITPLGDPIRQSYRVRIGLPEDTPLLVGMTVEVNIVIRRDDNALLIPYAALVDGPQGDAVGARTGAHVFVVETETAHRRSVRIGVIGDLSVEILDGLSEGDRVIVAPPAGLADGDPVRPVPAPAAAGA